jgi:hypothetical protein
VWERYVSKRRSESVGESGRECVGSVLGVCGRYCRVWGDDGWCRVEIESGQRGERRSNSYAAHRRCTTSVDSFFSSAARDHIHITTPSSFSSPRFRPCLADHRSSLDLSFNNIRHPPNLPSLGRVAVLYLVQNKIARIEQGELDWCAETITSLELGGNRIRVSRRGAGFHHTERSVD